MDSNKKQNFSGTGNSKTSNQTTDSSRQKSSSDTQASKYWPRNSRRRENPSTSARYNNSNSNSKQQISAKVRPNVDKRPRGRGYNSQNYGSSYRSANEDYLASRSGLGYEGATFSDPLDLERFGNTDYEQNSIYAPGGKRQNLNHLLNFYYSPREVDYYDNAGGNSAYNQRHNNARKHKYNKEQFLQANFQFVIKASAKSKTDDSPDSLIDWGLIEQINIQTVDAVQCPICLYPPVAGKVTRCGHVYCWPCILHYLSLSDKTWRKCPICYDAIHVGDLKSASIVQQQEFNDNSRITFRLMRRKKGSLYIEKYDNTKNDEVMEKYPYVSSLIEEKLFSKFILAKRNDVADILEREQKELLSNVDECCPEYVFIQQSLQLLQERRDKLGELEQKDDEKNKIEANLQAAVNETINVIENTQQLPTNNIKPNQLMELSLDTAPINGEQINLQEGSSASSSNIETNSIIQSSSDKKSSKFYYFYQSDDGQNIYLHPLNVKMLQACYGSLVDAPLTIKARILQKEQHSMDEDHRRKFTFLGHLPLTCQFAVVEIELQHPYVNEDIIESFKSNILFRKKERQRRATEECKREKHINAINERKMGKIISSTANINITSSHEFPKCGFEESLVSIEEADNVPSTSNKVGRSKTISTSSAGSCSYSAIAMNCKKEDSPWSTLNAAQALKSTTEPLIADQTAGGDRETSILSTIHTNLADVLAQALSEKDKKSIKTNESANTNSKKGSGNKKSKKNKKMLPLYSTGMNFSGN